MSRLPNALLAAVVVEAVLRISAGSLSTWRTQVVFCT
jgi:hypothetical protein